MPQQSLVPLEFRCSDEVNRVYERVRPEIIPVLRAKARVTSLAGYIDADDLLQEMEVASLYGVSTYNPEMGSLLHWVGVLASRTVSLFLRYSSAASRVGTLHFEECIFQYNNGSMDVVCDALIEASAEDYWMQREADLEAQSRRARFRAAVDWQLDGFARDLFWARINPSVELLIYSRNQSGFLPESPSQLSLKVVADFFGVDRARALAARSEVDSAVARAAGALEPLCGEAA